MSTPNVGIPYVPEGTLDPAAGLNASLNWIDALLQAAVIEVGRNSPPGSPSDGDMYTVGVGTGAWAGQDDNLARYVAEGAFWQFYVAGQHVKLVLNIADGELYKFLPDSGSGGWILAAGLSDAPSDGTVYGRRNAAWVASGSLTVESNETTPTVVNDVDSITFGDGLQITELTSGAVLLEATATASNSYATVVTETGTSRTAAVIDGNTYVRFTNAAAKTYTFDGALAYATGHEFHGRNVGAANLTIATANDMTINAPAGGTLVVPQHGAFTIKIVATDEADLFGLTVP